MNRLVLVAVLAIFLGVTIIPSIPSTYRADVFASTFAPSVTSSRQSDYRLINVSDYTGETDGERIQKALDDVGSEGATIFIPEGTWVACNLTAYTNTILMGSNATVIKRPAETTLPFIILDNQTDFEITGLIFDGQNEPDAAGVLIMDAMRFRVFNNTFVDIARNAIKVCGISTDFEVVDNLLVHTDIAPILLFGSPSTRTVRRFLVANNTLMNSTDNGKIGVAFSADGTVADNYVVGCMFGIATRDVSDITIRNNRIENSTSYGIYLGTQIGDSGSWNISIFDNHIVHSSIGIARYYGKYPISNVTLKGNTIVNNQQWDVYADFQGSFINNTFTSKANIKLMTIPLRFVGNLDLASSPIIPADMSGDGKVDLRDIGGIARLFGANINSGDWNPAADIIQDGVIDMKDISFASKCFSS